MAEFIPIKVKIGLRPNGHADHPDWTKLPLAQAGTDPATQMRGGWQYDKTSGHQESSIGSPVGVQYGVMLVTKRLATEALVVFPAIITVLTEAELETFWDSKAHGHMAPERTNTQALEALRTERELRIAVGVSTAVIDSRISKALDPGDREPGKHKDHLRRWADAKVRLDITIGTIP